MAKKKTSFDLVKEALDGCNIDDLPEVSSYIPTGCTIMNMAISNKIDGGIPIGRIIQVYGGSATCKSVLANTLLGYALRGGKEAFLADVEHALDPRFALKFGLDVKDKHCHIGEPKTLEDMFDFWIGGAIKTYGNIPKAMVVDSITSLCSKHELTKTMNDSQSRAPRAKAISEGLRRYIRELALSNTTLFCVDQTRCNMSGFGDAEVTTGGEGLKFYASTRIRVKHEANIVNASGVNIGIWVKFIIKKNRTAPPMRVGYFKLLYDYGVDDISSNLRWLAENRGCLVDEKKPDSDPKNWETCDEGKGKQVMTKVTVYVPTSDADGAEWIPETYTIKKWVREIEARNLEIVLRSNVATAWDDVYKSEERKERVW